jgi:hypothetical protein
MTVTARPQPTDLRPADASGSAADNESLSDFRALIRLVAAGGCGIDAMRLVRFHARRKVTREHWAAVGADALRLLKKEIRARLGRNDLCVPYDGASFLVLCPGADRSPLRALDGEFAETAGSLLAGAAGAPGLIEVLRPAAAGEHGLTFATADRTGNDVQAQTTSNAGGKARKMILGDATFRCFPLWDVRANDVLCYLWEASWDLGTGAILPEEALAGQFDDPHRVSALDMETLEKSAAELDRRLNQYWLAKFLIPVHFQTLADPGSGDAYLKSCNDRMWSVHEFAFFEIINPPTDEKPDQLADVAKRLAPFGAGMMLRIKAGSDAGRAVPREGFMSVGIDIRIDRRPAAEIAGDIKSLAASAGRRGLKTHVHGIHASPPSVMAACAAVDFVGTDAVADVAGGMQHESSPAHSLELLRKLAGAKARKAAG